MRDGATLINTSRGSLLDQDALVRELVSGRLDAVLDVTVPEVLPADSPLYDLPNVVLTPTSPVPWAANCTGWPPRPPTNWPATRPGSRSPTPSSRRTPTAPRDPARLVTPRTT